MLDVLLDALLDALKMLPFLLVTFFALEYLEHRASERVLHAFVKASRLGPLAGTAFGLIPQCGFSVMASSFFAQRVISVGTLLAVFISTSDEAIIVMLGNVSNISKALVIIGIKSIVAIVVGYIADAIFKNQSHGITEHSIMHEHEEHCHEGCGCSCNSKRSFIINALKRTVIVFLFVLISSVILGVLVFLLGEDKLHALLLSNSVFQPFISAFIGLIPNCAPSVILANMYMEGALSLGSAVAGFCTASGMGLLVLFRSNKNLEQNLAILAALYAVGAVTGVIIQAISMLF